MGAPPRHPMPPLRLHLPKNPLDLARARETQDTAKAPPGPTHMGGDVFGKVIKMQHEELRVRFFTDVGECVFGDNAMPNAFDAV